MALRVGTEWTRDAGDRIERALEEARTDFPDLPSMAATSPIEAVENGLSLTIAELARANAALEVDREARARSQELTARRQSAESQLALINEQIAAEVEGTAEIARLLADMVPHIHGNECVVCGRDYSEISDEPLAAKAARRASRFGEQAERLTALSQARQGVVGDQRQLVQEETAITSRVLEQPARSVFLTKQARLETWAARFHELEDVARDGSRILRESNEARRSLAAARNAAGTAAELAESVNDLCARLQLPIPAETDSVEGSLERVGNAIQLRSGALELRALVRRSIRETWRTRQRIAEELESGNEELKQLQEDGLRLQASHSSFEGKRDLARQIHRAATDAQRAIIRTVFNESLNAVWRDLFVRLAPNEPFVPAFHVADVGQGAGPQLVTVHRTGGNGGAPGAMLSSGNLNTAALTLFLALHLSAGDQMPMLILDDPVQSMDDVHISQFAALLRTLSKQHGRQVVVAVHERSLFDYLALELGPAFEGDRLITVELKKQVNGMTFVEPQYRLWKEDPVRASA